MEFSSRQIRHNALLTGWKPEEGDMGSEEPERDVDIMGPTFFHKHLAELGYSCGCFLAHFTRRVSK